MNLPLILIRKREAGFTLVEAIVVMVITGILAGIMVLFIRRPVQSYVDSAARADMGDVAELALRRMARELHTALPNSIRVTTLGGLSLLEFIPTKAGGLYLAVEDNAGVTLPALSFTNAGALAFNIVGPVPAAPYGIAVSDSIVVYNLGAGIQDADAYADASGTGNSNRAVVTLVNGSTISFVDPYRANNNPFANAAAAGRIPNTSPTHRFNVTTEPVTFACVNDVVNGRGTLTRFWGYGFSASQVDPSTLKDAGGAPRASSALMASNVLGCQFSVTSTANQHTGLVGMSIALARPATAGNALETVTLAHQIHVDNTP
jgi:MSHA biogenesis protein MshO